MQSNNKNSTNGQTVQGEQKEEMRLQQYMARCGVASRRASEEIITSGRVTVNGELVTELGTKVTAGDKVWRGNLS